MKKELFVATLLWMVISSNLQGQQAVVTSGGNASGIGGTVSYSIGQVAYSYVTGTTGSVEQGIQHAYEIYPVGTSNQADPDYSISVFPNPTADLLSLQVEHLDNKKLSFKLVDSGGNVLEIKTIETTQTQIAMGRFPAAIYFIQVYQGNQPLKSFKIIKNKA